MIKSINQDNGLSAVCIVTADPFTIILLAQIRRASSYCAGLLIDGWARASGLGVFRGVTMDLITREMLADAFENEGDADIVCLLQDPSLSWKEKAEKLRRDYLLPEETIRALTYEAGNG